MAKNRLFTRDFTLLALGQAFSLVGNCGLRFALSMYVLEQSGSAGLFAGLLAVAALPAILLTPFGGALADRCDRRKLMVALDAASGGAALLAAAALWRFGGLVPAAALLIVLSALGAFESPTVQACVPQLLSGDDVLRGNAVVNQISALAALATPFLGSLMYAALGLEPVLLAAGLCFFVTAGLELFIRLGRPARSGPGRESGLLADLAESLRFLRREEPGVLRLLLLAGGLSFCAAGAVFVGLPHLVRNVLGLSAEHYGAAESALAAAAVLGAMAAGILGPKLRRWDLLICAFGLALLPAAAAFALPLGSIPAFILLTASFCAGQLVCTLFSVLAVSMIQRRTPEGMTGKVMALSSALSMCSQPLGQLAYGLFFDLAGAAAQLVLLPTAAAIFAAGLASRWLRGLLRGGD